MKTYKPEELKQILDAYKKYVLGQPGGSRANLRSADLSGADLSGADLSGANLRSANLSGADLSGANLRSANLSGADLSGADLRSANLRSANLRSADLRSADLRSANLEKAVLPTGETWEIYLSTVVPELLKSGGRAVAEVVKEGWECHTWENCPMACAFGVKSENETPILLRPRVQQFVQFFDANLIPRPNV